jgi:aspartate/methionine/tyrosine aminotransferase
LIKLLETIICDKEFRDKYIPVYRQRLVEAERLASTILSEGGVKFFIYPSSLFIVLDFKDFIQTEEKEMEVLDKLLNEFHVFLLPAFAANHCKYPGEYRFVFSLEKEKLIEGCKRIIRGVKSISGKQ